MGNCQHPAKESEPRSEESGSESESTNASPGGEGEEGEDESGVESEVVDDDENGDRGEDGQDGVVGDVEPPQPPSLEVEPEGTKEAEEEVEDEQSGLGEGDAAAGHLADVVEEPAFDYFPDNQLGLELSPEQKPSAGSCLDLLPNLDVHTCARPLNCLRRAEHLPAEPLPAEPPLPAEASVEPVLVESDDSDVDGGDRLCYYVEFHYKFI